MRMKVTEVECRCGAALFKYQKRGEGRLIKCYLPRILKDYTGVPPRAAVGTHIVCPSCGARIGTVFGIKGVRAVKLNQGQIKPFRLG